LLAIVSGMTNVKSLLTSLYKREELNSKEEIAAALSEPGNDRI